MHGKGKRKERYRGKEDEHLRQMHRKRKRKGEI
jgi:hypothetical protein